MWLSGVVEFHAFLQTRRLVPSSQFYLHRQLVTKMPLSTSLRNSFRKKSKNSPPSKTPEEVEDAGAGEECKADNPDQACSTLDNTLLYIKPLFHHAFRATKGATNKAFSRYFSVIRHTFPAFDKISWILGPAGFFQHFSGKVKQVLVKKFELIGDFLLNLETKFDLS